VTDPSFKRRLLLQAGAAALLLPVTETRAAPAGLITRAIPRSGERLPAIGLGTYQVFDLPQSQLAGTELQAVLKRFVELGGAVVDSSPNVRSRGSHHWHTQQRIKCAQIAVFRHQGLDQRSRSRHSPDGRLLSPDADQNH